MGVVFIWSEAESGMADQTRRTQSCVRSTVPGFESDRNEKKRVRFAVGPTCRWEAVGPLCCSTVICGSKSKCPSIAAASVSAWPPTTDLT